MRYQVIKKTQHELGEPFAQFLSPADAYLFIKAKIEKDAAEGVSVNYYLFDNEELLDEIHGLPLQAEAGIETKSHVTFNPSPLSTVPKPPGVLSDYLIEEENNEKDND